MSEKIAVFVNGDNLYAFQRKSFWVDPKELLLWVQKTFGNVVDAYYYVSFTADNEKQINYIRALTYFGYTTRSKMGKRHELEPINSEESVEYEFEKANLDVEMACDMLKTATLFDRAILICPSKDILRPLELLKMDKYVTIIAAKNSTPYELMNAVGKNFIELNDLRDRVSRKEPRRKNEFSS